MQAPEPLTYKNFLAKPDFNRDTLFPDASRRNSATLELIANSVRRGFNHSITPETYAQEMHEFLRSPFMYGFFRYSESLSSAFEAGFKALAFDDSLAHKKDMLKRPTISYVMYSMAQDILESLKDARLYQVFCTTIPIEAVAWRSDDEPEGLSPFGKFGTQIAAHAIYAGMVEYIRFANLMGRYIAIGDNLDELSRKGTRTAEGSALAAAQRRGNVLETVLQKPDYENGHWGFFDVSNRTITSKPYPIGSKILAHLFALRQMGISVDQAFNYMMHRHDQSDLTGHGLLMSLAQIVERGHTMISPKRLQVKTDARLEERIPLSQAQLKYVPDDSGGRLSAVYLTTRTLVDTYQRPPPSPHANGREGARPDEIAIEVPQAPNPHEMSASSRPHVGDTTMEINVRQHLDSAGDAERTLNVEEFDESGGIELPDEDQVFAGGQPSIIKTLM